MVVAAEKTVEPKRGGKPSASLYHVLLSPSDLEKEFFSSPIPHPKSVQDRGVVGWVEAQGQAEGAMVGKEGGLRSPPHRPARAWREETLAEAVSMALPL